MVSAFTRKVGDRFHAARPEHRVQPLHNQRVHFGALRKGQFAQLVVNGGRQIDRLLNGGLLRRAPAAFRRRGFAICHGRHGLRVGSPPEKASQFPKERFYAALT